MDELIDKVLEWWNEHKYDEVIRLDGEHDNAFDEEPEFVKIAKRLKEEKGG